MWVRGLKLCISQSSSEIKVAPYVGAWIETLHLTCRKHLSPVAPYVGAWIETVYTTAYLDSQLSHPMWVRGLKHNLPLLNRTCTNVAPYVGAWIETWQQATEQSRHLVAPYVGACIKLYCCSVKT